MNFPASVANTFQGSTIRIMQGQIQENVSSTLEMRVIHADFRASRRAAQLSKTPVKMPIDFHLWVSPKIQQHNTSRAVKCLNEFLSFLRNYFSCSSVRGKFLLCAIDNHRWRLHEILIAMGLMVLHFSDILTEFTFVKANVRAKRWDRHVLGDISDSLTVMHTKPGSATAWDLELMALGKSTFSWESVMLQAKILFTEIDTKKIVPRRQYCEQHFYTFKRSTSVLLLGRGSLLATDHTSIQGPRRGRRSGEKKSSAPSLSWGGVSR